MKEQEKKGCVHPEDNWTNYHCGDCGDYANNCGCSGPKGSYTKKQVEEIAKNLKELAKIIRTILEDRTDIKYIPDLDFPIAKEVLKHYQPKLPEHSVVLSGEQCVEIVQDNYNIGYERGSKETAEKILNEIDCIPTNEVNELNHLRLLKINIAKQFNVKYKNCFTEIVDIYAQ